MSHTHEHHTHDAAASAPRPTGAGIAALGWQGRLAFAAAVLVVAWVLIAAVTGWV